MGTSRTALRLLTLRSPRLWMSNVQTSCSSRRSVSSSWQISSCRMPEKSAIKGSQKRSSRITRLPERVRRSAEWQPRQIGESKNRASLLLGHIARWSLARLVGGSLKFRKMLVSTALVSISSSHRHDSAERWRWMVRVDRRETPLSLLASTILLAAMPRHSAALP